MRGRAVAPKPLSVLDAELLLSDPDVAKAVTALTDYLRDPGPKSGEEPRLWGFPETTVAAINRLARRKAGEDFDERSFVKMMKRTEPRARQPRRGDRCLDLWFALAQPEILEGYWSRLDPRTGERGRHPGFAAKAFAFFVATLGVSAHFDDNFDFFRADARVHALFNWIEHTAALASQAIPLSFGIRSYEQTLRQMHRICQRISPTELMELNVALVREVHRLLGIDRTYLSIDGMVWKAWVAQVGKRNPQREVAIRRVATNATPMQVGYEFTRGYRLVALVDILTGLPLVWTFWPGMIDEARALRDLLHRLYALWPEVRVEAIVADAAWDEAWAGEWCLVNYGIPLVAHRHPTLRGIMYPLSEFESQRIASYSGDGTVYCRVHGVPMIRDGFEFAPRVARGESLAPGDPANPAAFRVRAHCPVSDSCGRPGLRVRHNYSALALPPHSLAAGDREGHALRLALFARRNASEALHSALQVGHKLGLSDAGRMRTAKEPTVEALTSLALIYRSARVLADQRILSGEFPPAPPPDLAAILRP